MNTPKRYNPILVTLHWLTVIFLLSAGTLTGLGGSSIIDPHMVLGAILVIILVTRLIVRFSTRLPAWASTGNPFFDKLGELVHWGMYLVAFYILGTGGLIAYNRNLFAVALGAGKVHGGAGFLGEIHQLGWLLAILMLFAHVGAALYHQFFLKDNLFSRMWYGK